MLRENRGCSCMEEENNEVPERVVNRKEQEELLSEIRCHEFSITELALYLDTHPDDKKALCLHRKYCNELENMRDMYQKVYGSLMITYPCNKWRWLEEPWPWEGGEN